MLLYRLSFRKLLSDQNEIESALRELVHVNEWDEIWISIGLPFSFSMKNYTNFHFMEKSWACNLALKS